MLRHLNLRALALFGFAFSLTAAQDPFPFAKEILSNEYIRVLALDIATESPKTLVTCLLPSQRPWLTIGIDHPRDPEIDLTAADGESGYFFTPHPMGGAVGCTRVPHRQTYEIELKKGTDRSGLSRDAVKVDPDHNKILFEDQIVRVVSVHFKPGESGPIVDKRPRVIILLDDMHAVVTLPDGHSEPRDGKAGTVYWGNAGAQATKNVGDKPFENIVVELKEK